MASKPSLFERMYASPQMAAQRAAAAQLSSSLGQSTPQWATSYEGYQKSSLMDRTWSSPQVLAGQAAAQQMLVGAGLSQPATLEGGTGGGGAVSTGGGAVSTGGGAVSTGGGTTLGSGTVAADGDIISQLYSARPQLQQQQIGMLSQFGPAARQAVLAASPELAAASGHVQSTFSDPFGGALSTFQDAIRSAQAARGFTGGGTGLVGEEARYLTNFAMQRRDQMAPFAAQLGGQTLGLGGLGQDSMFQLGSLALQQKQLEATIQAGQSQSSWSQQMYNQQLGDLQNQQLQQLISQYGGGSTMGRSPSVSWGAYNTAGF